DWLQEHADRPPASVSRVRPADIAKTSFAGPPARTASFRFHRRPIPRDSDSPCDEFDPTSLFALAKCAANLSGRGDVHNGRTRGGGRESMSEYLCGRNAE